MSEPHWLRVARESMGQKETLGPNDSPWIRRMWAKLSGSWLLGQPWCGGAMAFWMQSCGIKEPPAFYRAKAWLDWGTPVGPSVGAVVVFARKGGGHVGIIVGKTDDGRLLVLGANQRDSVSIAAFDAKRAVGYRWPTEWLSLAPAAGSLPVLAWAGASSSNEA